MTATATKWMPEGAEPISEPWMPEGAEPIEPERIPLGTEPMVGNLFSPRQTYDGLKAKTINRPKQILTLSEETGLPVDQVADIHDQLDRVTRMRSAVPWTADTTPLFTPDEVSAAAADVARGLKETPDDLLIGGLRIGQNTMEAAQRYYELYLQEAVEGEEEPEGEGGMPAVFGLAWAPVKGLADMGAAWFKGRADEKTNAQAKVTLAHSPFTAMLRSVLQQGVPSMGLAMGLTMLTGNPALGYLSFYETTAGQSYAEQRRAGAGKWKAAFISSASGWAEVGGEMLVLPKFIKGATQGIPLRNVFELVAENYGQEFATGFTQGWLEDFGKRTSAGEEVETAAVAALDEAWTQAKEGGLVGGATALLTGGLIDAAQLPASVYLRASEVRAREAKPAPAPVDSAPRAPEISTQETDRPALQAGQKHPADMTLDEFMQTEIEAPDVYRTIARNESQEASRLVFEVNRRGIPTSETHQRNDEISLTVEIPFDELPEEIKQNPHIMFEPLDYGDRVVTFATFRAPDIDKALGALPSHIRAPEVRMSKETRGEIEADYAYVLDLWKQEAARGPSTGPAEELPGVAAPRPAAAEVVSPGGVPPAGTIAGQAAVVAGREKAVAEGTAQEQLTAEQLEKARGIREGDRVRGARRGKIYQGLAAEILHGESGKPTRIRIENNAGDTVAVLYADEVSKIEVAPEQPITGPKEGIQPPAPGEPGATETAYRAMRKRELAKTSRYIKESAEYQVAEEESEAKGFTPTGVGLFYFEPKYRGDIEGTFGVKGEKGSNKAAWRMISFEKGVGQGWDQAQQELGWGTTVDEFLARIKDFAEGDIAPDVLDVAQSSGNIDLETAALKRSMLQNGRPVKEINAAIEENVKGGQHYAQLSNEEVDAIIEAHRIRMAKGEAQAEIDVSVGAAEGNFPSRRRAIDRAQKKSRKTGQPWYVVQRANGTYAALPERPATGHYTMVDMKQALQDQVRFVKQASPTAEESFDYGEHPRESLKHLSELERFKKRLKERTAEAREIAGEMWDYVKKNVPAAHQGSFVPLLSRIGPGRATKYNLQDLMRAIAKTEDLLRGLDKRAAISEFKDIWSEAKAAMKKMDQATRGKLQKILGDVDIAKLSDRKKKDMASLANYLNRVADALAAQQMDEAAAREAVMSIPRARIEALQRLGKTALSDMSAEDIRTLAGEIRSFLHQQELKTRLIGARKAKARAQALAETLAEVTPLPTTEEPTTETGIFQQGQLARFFTSASAHLDTLAERITKPGDTTTMQLLVKDIWDGWRVRSEVRRQAARMMKEGTQQIGFTADDFDGMSNGVTVEIGGKAQTITRWDLLSLYMHSKDDSNVREILKAAGLEFNGVTVPTFSSYVEMAEAVSQLNSKEQDLGDLFTDINKVVLAPAINKASMELEGRELAENPHYWHRGRVFPKRVAGRIADVAIEDTGPFQPRTGGKVPIEIVPFHIAASDAIDAASTYSGMAVPLYNARSIVNTAEWQNAVKTAGYEDAMNSIFTLYRRMQAYGSDTGIIDSLGKKVLTRFGASRLALRISSMVGQYAGIPVAASEIPAKYFLLVRPNRKLLERCMELSPVLDDRWSRHHLNLEAGNVALLASYKGLFFGKQPLLDKPLNLLARADGQVGSIMAGAIEKQLRAERPDLQPGTEAFDREVAYRLEYAIRRTQGSWDIVDRSVMLSDVTVATRVMGMFRTALEAQWNIFLRAVNQYQKSAGTAADRVVLGEAVGLVLASAFIEAALKWGLYKLIKAGFWATLRALGLISPDDEPEKESETKEVISKLAVKTGENVLSLLPGGNLLGGLVNTTYKAATGAGKRPTEPMAGALEALRDQTWAIIPDAMQLGRDLITGETYKSGARKDEPKWQSEAPRLLFKIGDVVSMVTGAPFSGPAAEFREPIEGAIQALQIQGMTRQELIAEIRANTYGPTAKEHKPGTAHEGKEIYLNLLRTELQKR